MAEAKPMASLSSTLLARKGQAKPAMRPQGFASFGFGAPHVHEDLGWNDMGHDGPEHVMRDHGLGNVAEPASPPVSPSADIVPITSRMAVDTPIATAPQVLRQQEELARDLGPGALARAPRAAPGSKGKAAFTLRLDPDRHLRLRLVCAVSHKSAQMVVTEALDALLAGQPSVAELARTAVVK